MTRKSWLWITGAVVLLGVFLVDVSPAWAQAVAPKAQGVKIDGDYGPFLPPDVPKNGHKVDELINLVHWFMGVLFVGWGIFFVYCLVRFRQRPGHQANCELIKAKPFKYAGIGVAIFEAVILLGFSMPIWASVKNDIPPPTDNPVRIRVVAEQFAWNFHYPGADGKFGRVEPKFIDTRRRMGYDEPAMNSLHSDAGGDSAR